MNPISGKKIRLLHKSDLNKILLIQANAYRLEFNESIEVFDHKIDLFPEGCLGVWNQNSLIAYAFAHPWIKDQPIPLNEHTFILPTHPDLLYIHDVAVHRKWHRMGVAHQLVKHLIKLAQHNKLSEFALVAVQGTESFWEQFDFRRIRSFEYAPGISATYMYRTIS
jgi:ribosomal protein S18 acetylase RimI-like enzyme